MKNRMLSLKKIRDIHYKGQTIKLRSMGIEMNDFLKNPYTYFKSRFYIETSALMVYFLQFTNISPNFITFFYSFLSLSVLFLLSSNNDSLILLSVILLFSKGTLDWADGLLARIQKKTSNLGFLLDNWGALIGSYSYLLGLGFYTYNKNNEIIFIFLGFLIIFIKAIDLRNYAYHLAMYYVFKEKNKKSFLKKLNLDKHSSEKKSKNKSSIIFLKNFIQNFLDERSRSIDLICLIILIDTFYYPSDLIKYIYFFIILKNFIIFVAGIYYVIYKEYIFKK